MAYKTITPTKLKERLERNEPIVLVDVREPSEYHIARIEGAELLPLSRINEWAEMLHRDEEIVVMCHHGIRSAQVCAYLIEQGFTELSNLAGGIDAWSLEVDPTVPRY
jgi:adenylyltransferase/sulfurtransferase